MPKPKVRYEVEWQELTPAARQRREKSLETYEHDRDRDEISVYEIFPTKEQAVAYARTIVDAYQTVYGAAMVTKQAYLKVEGTNLYDWENVEEPEYVD